MDMAQTVLEHGDTLEAIARRIHAEMEIDFPGYTRLTWEQLLPHTKGVFLLRALDELRAR